MGRYTIMMINSPNNVGRRTSMAASRITASRLRQPAFAPRQRTQFSTITTELSTINPKSMAPRLNSVAAIPNRIIPENANIIDNGIANATISPALRLPRNKNNTEITSKPPSNRFRRTVSMT